MLLPEVVLHISKYIFQVKDETIPHEFHLSSLLERYKMCKMNASNYNHREGSESWGESRGRPLLSHLNVGEEARFKSKGTGSGGFANS